MKTVELKIEGMFCANCENAIEKNLNKLDGVISTKASYSNEKAIIQFDENKVTQKDIEKTILNLGYKVISKKSDKTTIICILIILLALYVIFDALGFLDIFNIFPSVDNTMSYGMIFIVGLLTSLHCIAMCGGINLTQSVSSSQKNENGVKSNILYNLGRIISYTLIGGIVGAIGSVISLGGTFKGLIQIITGILMIIMGINMLGIFPAFRKINIRIPKKLSLALNKAVKGKSSFYIGLVNGLMPCGPLQSMQLYALATGSFLKGAISMFLFSLGTVPLMLLFGIVTNKLNKKFTKSLLTISSIIIFFFGVNMLSNGLSLSGISLKFNLDSSSEISSKYIDDYQLVEITVDYGSYEDFTVQAKIPVKLIINVPEGKLNGCNNEIIISEYDIDIKLQTGENIVEFTPEETGTFNYSCWMGMITNYITVVE